MLKEINMKSFVLSLVLVLSASAQAEDLVDLREATQEEINQILSPEQIKEMQEAGKKLHLETENSTREAVLLEKLKLGLEIPNSELQDYLKQLLAQGKKTDEVKAHIQDLARQYFALLQTRDMDKLINEKDKNEQEQKINDLKVRFDKGEISEAELKQGMNELEKLLIHSPIYQTNLESSDLFKNKMETLLAGVDPKSIEAVKEDGKFSDFKMLVPKNFSANHGPLFASPDCVDCKEKALKEALPIVFSDLNLAPNEKGLPGRFYFMWGYNRSWHSLSDATFKTSEGTFTIHDAKGYDRPSPLKSFKDFIVYVNPSQLSIPQYNMKIGYMFNEKWGIEVAQDHMKWVFDNTLNYRMTGEFSPDLFVKNEDRQNEWDVHKPITFDEAKATGNASWLNFEHTDGYNYVNVGAVYNQNLYKTKNNKFAVDLRGSAGAGVLIPKTQVYMHRDQQWNHVGMNNKFHVAGYGAHADVRLKLTFWDRVFVEAATKGSIVKIENALVDGTSNRLEQTPISSVQLIGSIGYQQPLYKKKKKKINPLLEY